MYYPIGLPKCLSFSSTSDGNIQTIVCNRDRILFAVLCENTLWILYSRPCVPLVSFQRSLKSIIDYGTNNFLEWRPDSSMLVIATNKNILLFYSVTVNTDEREAFEQIDSPQQSLRRYSAELFTKEKIPPLNINQIYRLELAGAITSLVCLRDELMVSTNNGHLQRVKWDGTVNYDYCIDLSRIPFCDDQLVMKAVPLEVSGTGLHITQLEYSPLVGGFAIVLSDGRAAFLTASTLKFDPNAVQGIWARELDDACCAAINHKYRLLAFGRENGQGIVLMVDEATGGLEICHRLVLSSKDFVGTPGAVVDMRWTPDGTVLGMCWTNGGFSLWSVFGSLLSTSLQWDFSTDPLSKPFCIKRMEWGAEGYEAWCIKIKNSEAKTYSTSSLCSTSNTLLHHNNQRSSTSSMNLLPFDPSTAESLSKSAKSDSVFEVTEESEATGVNYTSSHKPSLDTCVVQMSFLKSALAVNPCMSRLERVLLQGSDRLYLSSKEGLGKGLQDLHLLSQSFYFYPQEDEEEEDEEKLLLGDSPPHMGFQKYAKHNIMNAVASKQWIVVPIPYTYTAANWPIRYTCVDDGCEYIGIAGRNGVAHYSFNKRKWRLFGNENQEGDLVVTGGLLWWRDSYLTMGAYDIPSNADQIRLYPKDQKLDNEFVTIVPQSSQVLLLNIYCDQMIVLTSDCRFTVYSLVENIPTTKGGFCTVTVTHIQEVDISSLTVHPACVVSVGLTSLRTESWKSNSNHPVRPPAQSIIFNISGKVLMIQRDRTSSSSNDTSLATTSSSDNVKNQKLFQNAQMTPIVLASCCESLWWANRTVSHKPHLSHALWLHCGAHGTRAWLPLFPSPGVDRGHTFMSRRIMLPFIPSIYPLAVLFEEAIMIGAETDSSLMACDKTTLYQPLVYVEKTSQVYLHHLLRQLLRRNLGYHAWEVANTCRHLPYFPHSLELLLHQVLEEEATSKDPIPDSLLPRVLDFIREFPVYLLTIVQCARKTELALWRYLFSVAGSPRHLFTQALSRGELETAASYLIILQNLESPSVSRTYATRLLEATLEASKWELSNDLIRFLRSIDPNDFEVAKPSPPISISGTRIGFNLATPPVSPQCADEDLSMIMPNTQVLRGRSFSSASGPKAPGAAAGNSEGSSIAAFSHLSLNRTTSDSAKVKGHSGGPPIQPLVSEFRKVSTGGSAKDLDTVEDYFLDVILQRRAKKLLLDVRLKDLGTMAAHLDFPLVSWFSKERLRAAAVNDFVFTLRQIHIDFSWPFPIATTPSKIAGSPIESSQFLCLEDQTRNLSIGISKGGGNSLNGRGFVDSGYLSQSTRTQDTTETPITPQHNHPLLSLATNPLCLPATSVSSSGVHAAMLLPHHTQQPHLSSGDMLSIKSEETSLYDNESGSVEAVDWSPDNVLDPTRNLLLRSPDPPLQAHPKPPLYAEVQLRYLLQIFLEAGCLEMSIILAVILRDAMAFLRAVGLARSLDTPTTMLLNLVQGLSNLKVFVDTQCLGYQSFISAVSNQIQSLEHLAQSRNSFGGHQSSLASSGVTQNKTAVGAQFQTPSPSGASNVRPFKDSSSLKIGGGSRGHNTSGVSRIQFYDRIAPADDSRNRPSSLDLPHSGASASSFSNATFTAISSNASSQLVSPSVSKNRTLVNDGGVRAMAKRDSSKGSKLEAAERKFDDARQETSNNSNCSIT